MPRGEMIRKYFHEPFRIADIVIVQTMQRFGGSLPEEIVSRNPEALLWGYWVRDMKRAIDQSGGLPPALLPFPPLPSWFKSNPAIDALCVRLGVPVSPTGGKSATEQNP